MKAMLDISVQVLAEWDDEAGVWVATSQDVPGLVVESSDFREMQKMVIELIPILLIENDMLPEFHEAREVPVHIAGNAISKGRALVGAHG